MARPASRDPASSLLRQQRGKIAHAHLLVEAIDLARVPRPLDGVLAAV